MITKTSLRHPTVRAKLRKAMREAVDKHNAGLGGVSVIDGDIGLCFYMPHIRGLACVSQHGFSFRGKKQQDFTSAVFGGAA